MPSAVHPSPPAAAPPNKLRTSRQPALARFPSRTRTKKIWILGTCSVLDGFPEMAFADPGTPLMWASMSHPVIGNAIIGVAEGLVLARLFSLKNTRTLALLVAANYFSA